jgi:serpin B
MRALLRPALTAALAALTACSGENPAGPITTLPRPLTQVEGQLVQADNRFAFKLLQATLRGENSSVNVFVSPVSFAMALGMTWNGANGATESALLQTLELSGLTRDSVNAAYRSLINLLRGLDPNVVFTLANSIWYRQDYVFDPAFLETNRTYFDAEVQGLDFTSPASADRVNTWVTDRTQGRITSIVPTPLPRDAIMYLINAIYFRANWTRQFDAARTQNGPFHRADGSTVSVPMMTHGVEVPVRVHREPGVFVLDLPYGGGAWSATIVMPEPGSSLDSLAEHITPAQWDGWIAGLDSTEAVLFLPKFTLRYELSGAKAVLRALGMQPAFCDDVPFPDFTRMYPSGHACITDVVHKTFVLVDESGTEAAAATSVGMGVVSVPQPISVDRPFLFAIRERYSGTILFLGRIADPSAGP